MKLSLAPEELARLSPDARKIYTALHAGAKLTITIDNDSWWLNEDLGQKDEDGYPIEELLFKGGGPYGADVLDYLAEILGIETESV
ncbi:hypothetical protein CcrRB23_gp375 [Caulobacter phage RB23]|nr:hypothetical protein CcrRB23_gp375 [Caulobacter phage RB23]